MNKHEVKALLEKFDAGNCSEEELAMLESWYITWRNEEPLKIESTVADRSVERIWARLQENEENKSVKLWPGKLIWWASAAAVFIVMGIGFYFYKNQHAAPYANDIAPGSNKAYLILADGSTISLSDAKAGLNIQDNQLHYNDGTQVKTGSKDLSLLEKGITINTPRGGTYQISLQDGTRVWLNAASSLTYHKGLNKRGERIVTLNGEAYFEVAKDKIHPFIVQSKKQRVEVLGTHFNISNYDDDSTARTTLLEGSVKINETMLKPGQQSVITGNQLKVVPANIELAMAWKKEDFIFEGEDFKTTMRKIGRWYDVDIEYAPGVREDIELGGWISRKSKLSEVLEKIEQVGNVHFKVEGRRIIVEK
ncbi:transmembrane sensor [Pedobacter africanus]|uniref:Ferric-dicitrate binding protein FerR (Iron transport regulator) n=1 Tax=Pedobacter africanus TaxID=151894 RepID=A0ACC6KS68_9SPHI|nr:FecR family protein [Pedobacter africanus]MDR6782200.1 ferric-dicitrate binding protein FerR (iron transport regulator) [Pedobacter africanus]